MNQFFLALFIFVILLSQGRAIEKISNPISGQSTDGDSDLASISANGNLVVFESRNQFLVPSDINGNSRDTFLFNRITKQISLIGLDSDGDQPFGGSSAPVISSNGKFVLFFSSFDLDSEVMSNGSPNVFLRDLDGNSTRIVSRSTAGDASSDAVISADLSADGRYIVFDTYGSNLVTGDSSFNSDIYLHDRLGGPSQTGTTVRITPGPNTSGQSMRPSISNDGRFIFFTSTVTNFASGASGSLELAYVYDRQLPGFIQLSNGLGMDAPNMDTIDGVVAGDGVYAVFLSSAQNLTADDTRSSVQAFRCRIATGETELVSKNSEGIVSDRDVEEVICSDDGRFILFVTNATDFSGEPTRFYYDVYLRDMATGQTRLISQSSNGDLGAAHSEKIAISGTGRYVGFQTQSGNLAPPDIDGKVDILLADNPVLRAAEIAAAATARQRAALRRSLSKRIRIFRGRLQRAQRAKQIPKVRRFSRQIRVLQRRLRRI